MTVLDIRAGRTAFEHIRNHGLTPSDIAAVMGASGAAKWLVLYGLDSAVFSTWFKGRTDPLALFGTSIGAWKLSAAAQKNPENAFDRLKDAYIHQVYNGDFSPETIAKETDRVMARFMPDNHIQEVLAHPVFRLAFSAIRCRGLLISPNKMIEACAIWSAFGLNLMSRRFNSLLMERTVFHTPRFDTCIFDMSEFPTRAVTLDQKNFESALLASASIPMIMKGVSDIPGALQGTYRDGGLLDYHPIFPLKDNSQGFILYPHFYPYLKPGWFDKKLPNRQASGAILDRVVLISPSEEFVSRLPNGRIPDRQDFIRYKGKDKDRITAWEKAADMSTQLGDAFLELTASKKIQTRITPLN